MRRLYRELWPIAAVALMSCASAPPVVTGPTSELVMSHDDARASSPLAFPTDSYESVVRFQLPEGEHRPLRLRFQAEAAGSIEINLYDSNLLESPGEVLRTIRCDLSKDELSDGRDGRWVVEDLVGLEPLKGVVWVGVHRLGGTPALWASAVVSGQAFVRDNDPTNPMGLLPTKRTPMIRLEVAP